MFALLAEWQALRDPQLDSGVAGAKFTWWCEEIHRLAGGAPLHPITRYLGSLPRADAGVFTRLEGTLAAIGAELAGVPLARTADLETRAAALGALPLLVAARLGEATADEAALRPAVEALAAGAYLGEACRRLPQAAHAGRCAFPLEELRAAGLEAADLAAEPAASALRGYLRDAQLRAAAYCRAADARLPPHLRAAQRHVLILAALAARRLTAPARADAVRTLDLLLAWRTARRAARTR